ncbi:hypothetical protein P692DRAFT_20956923 [Suillus brevipes Sb2]|nr:hypothetical protein P692DRAFT_20956923 [Suillus brevipes Sb2]
MPFVRRHVTLKTAKADCDKELRRVIYNITAFFEERLRDGDQERGVDCDYRIGTGTLTVTLSTVTQNFFVRLSCTTLRILGLHLRLTLILTAAMRLNRKEVIVDQHALPEDDITKLPSLSHHPEKPAASTLASSNHVRSPIVASATLADVVNPRKQSNAMPPTAWPAQSRSFHTMFTFPSVQLNMVRVLARPPGLDPHFRRLQHTVAFLKPFLRLL